MKRINNPERFFLAADSAFCQSARLLPASSFYMCMGQKTILIECIGAKLLESATQAFSHLEIVKPQNKKVDLTLKIWDSVSTGVQMPSPSWGAYDYGPRGEIRGFNNERFNTVYQVNPGCLSILDNDHSTGIFWIRDQNDYPEWMKAAPLRTLLSWWFSKNGLQFVHGAGVGLNGKGAIIAGKGGSGKSTTSLLCLANGFEYIGDDYVMLDMSGDPKGHSVYGSAKIDDFALGQYFPNLKRHVINRIVGQGAEKGVLFLDGLFEQLCSIVSIDVVIIPRRSEQKTASIQPASPAAALAALAPTTLFQLSGAGQSAFSVMSDLVHKVPAYELLLGSDAVSATRVIRDLLETP